MRSQRQDWEDLGQVGYRQNLIMVSDYLSIQSSVHSFTQSSNNHFLCVPHAGHCVLTPPHNRRPAMVPGLVELVSRQKTAIIERR